MNVIQAIVKIVLVALFVVVLVSVASAVDLVDATTPAHVNSSLGDLGAPAGHMPWFPAPNTFGGEQDLVFDSEPDLSMTTALGNWLTDPANLNGNWSASVVPGWYWNINEEIALVYEIDAGSGGTLAAHFDHIDNGIHIWVDGTWMFGARDPEGRDWKSIWLGTVSPGVHHVQILLEDSGGAARYVGPKLTLNDVDADDVADSADNCIEAYNPWQQDSNGDNIGNACDADLNNDCIINAIDLGLMKLVFFTGDADADLDGNGVVNAVDLGIMKASFFGVPGPSGLTNPCD